MKAMTFLFSGFTLCLIIMSFEFEAFSLKDTDTEVMTQSEASAPFDVMMQVLTHQRCVNCHPSGDRPRQGDESRVHKYSARRRWTWHAQCEM